jgi:hypothetical protein
MTQKRKRFANPKAVLLKFEEKELALVDSRLQVERATRPSLTRAEFLRELILGTVIPDTETVSDKPTPCQWCGRLFPQHKLPAHEEQCGLNPKWKERRQSPSAEVLELVQFRRWMEDKLTQIEGHLSAKVDIMEQFQFRGRAWHDLSPEEQQKLLDFFLHPAIGGAPRQFRPSQFKTYLTQWGVNFSLDLIQGKQDEIAAFLHGQLGSRLGKNAKGFYTHEM